LLYRAGGHIKQQNGFSLIEIAVVLVIASFLIFGGVKLLAATAKNKQYSDTRNNLETVNAALVQFVSREKRLPCPADGTVATGEELRTSGVPSAACTDGQRNGVVPWKALGLTESDASDGWFNRITYRVAEELIDGDAMKFSDCDPAGVGPASSTPLPRQRCLPSCVSPGISCTPINEALKGKGLTVKNLALVAQTNQAGTTGAAYVLISHGENTTGAYNSSGILQSGSIPSGTAEITNANNRVLQTEYVADNVNAADAPAHFDDIVVYKTVHWVVGQARLDARSH
jgi:prepilin-type N-terminal cleavage/methylation domain-containing protein